MDDIVASRRKPWPFAVAPLDDRLWVRQWTPLALVLLGAIVMRHLVVANTCVCWLITLAERAWDGQRLYVDVLETNPPASIFLYVLPVALAHGLGLPPEGMV